MITLTSARRRAEEFAAAVDAPTDATTRPELAELVGVASALRTHASETGPAAVPRAEFTARLRERLLAEAAGSWSYDPAVARLELPARPAAQRERRLVVAATALVLAGGSAGMAAAAQQSLPGEALYPVKRGIETVRADLTSDEASRGRTLLEQADGRLVEIRTLLTESATDPAVGSTLETYVSQAEEGSDLLIGSYVGDGDPASVSDVRGFARNGIAELGELAALAPADLQDDLEAAAVALEEIDVRASEACPTCAPSNLTMPVSFQPALDDAARVLASLEGKQLSNDHPLVSTRIAPSTTLRPADGAGADKAAGDAPSGSPDGAGDVPLTPNPDDADVPGLPVLPEKPLGGLPKADTGTTAPDAANDVLGKTSENVEQLEKSVRDTVRDVKDAVKPVDDVLNDRRLP